MLYAFVVATILITLAELGDKTQLLTLGLACRYKPWQVLVGILAATLVLFSMATAAGQLVGNLVPDFWLAIVTGVLFVGFGVWTLRGEKDEGHEAEGAPRRGMGPIMTTAVAFFLAELGDKTQIMTMTVAADPAAVLRAFGGAGESVESWLASAGLSATGLGPVQSFVGVWLGATLGMMIADGLAILVGAYLGKKLPERLITRVSGTIFILFGLASLVSAFAR